MRRKEKINIVITYAMLTKIKKFKEMTKLGNEFRIPWKLLQTYPHLHRDKTRQLVDEYLYIKKTVTS